MADISRFQFENSDDAGERLSRRVWRFIRRYELVELGMIIGGIFAAWAGVIISASYL